MSLYNSTNMSAAINTIGNLNIRSFCVTLQELPEKWDFIAKHFKERGFNAEPFNGISAAVSGLKTLHEYNLDNPGGHWNIGVRPVATWLSFYMLWAAMNLLPNEHFFTTEWDCELPPDWRPRTEAALRDVPPDFDLLYIGSCCCQGHPNNRHIKGNVYETKNVQCGHCTIVAKKALPILLKTQRKVYAPLDISVQLHSLPMLKTFVVLPRIATQFGTNIPA